MQGLLWAFLSALFAGLTGVFAKIGIVSINSNLATAIRTTIIVVFTWLIALSSSRPADLLQLPFRSWLFLFLSAVGARLCSRFFFLGFALCGGGESGAAATARVCVCVFFSCFFFGAGASRRGGGGGGV